MSAEAESPPPSSDPVETALTEAGGQTSLSHGMLVCEFEAPRLLPLVELLKAHGFDLFLDVTAVDWPKHALRFEVVYHFYATKQKRRVRLKTRVPELSPRVPTLKPLYGSAGYMERECHDMYGIDFEGNDDLRPILLYERFEGHPLRKDYPKEREQPLVPYRF